MPHQHTAGWGIYPVLFHIGGYAVPTYSVMVILALVVGGVVYWRRARLVNERGDKVFLIPLAALVGGVLGAKIPVWVEMLVLASPAPHSDLTVLFAGRTIVGGLLGGTAAVMLVKRFLGIKGRKGNLLAPAIAAGFLLGRIGCFLGGCCYGIPTASFLGVDFGDGVTRHPTQLYEAAFALGMFVFLTARGNQNKYLAPGKLFDYFLNGYFGFRFLIEFIRVEPAVLGGLTMYQLLCIAGLLFVNRPKKHPKEMGEGSAP